MKLNQKTRFIREKLLKSSIWAEVDESLLPLINSINSLPGITTDVSCEGHQRHYPYLYLLLDGSQESIQSLGVISYCASQEAWSVLGRTLNDIGEISFYFALVPSSAVARSHCKSLIKIQLHGEDQDRDFYQEFASIAKAIEAFSRKKSCNLKKPLFAIPQNQNSK